MRSQLNGDLKYEKAPEPQDLSAIHSDFPDSCSRRLETVALPTLGRAPHVKDPNGFPLHLIKNRGKILGSWLPQLSLIVASFLVENQRSKPIWLLPSITTMLK